MATGLSTSFTTFTDQTVLDAASVNRLQGNDTFFAKVPYVRATRVVDQEVSHNTMSPVRFNTPEIDAEGHWQGSGTASHTDFVVKMTGYYQLSAQLTWAAASTGVRSLRIIKNATVTLARVDQAAHAQAGIGLGQQVTTEAYMAAGDVVQVHAFHTQGAVLAFTGGQPYSPVFVMRFVRLSSP